MPTVVVVRKDSYHDSILLMRTSRMLKEIEGVEDAVVVMGTPHNRELLKSIGYGGPELDGAGPNDLVLGARGEGVSRRTIEDALDAIQRRETPTSAETARPTNLREAVHAHPEANLVLISVPGEHAAREARRALALGRHVMVFSDNVTIEDEVALKRTACDKGLLMMGPDCGTAMLNGLPLGFANAVRPGVIGIVGASGTGIQEVASCIHRLGGGISQAIGTGGRDLSEAVGGAMTLLGLAALAEDPATRVIVVVSKPPSPEVADRVILALEGASKPGVVHFVGAEPAERRRMGSVVFADSLAGAAETACRLAGTPLSAEAAVEAAIEAATNRLADRLAAQLPRGARLRGIFCGGTTGHEALVLLSRAGLEIRSNLHKKGDLRITGSHPLPGHVLLDLGDDLFTMGRPHPMIEPILRNDRLALEVADPETGLLLFDVILGYGSHADPAGILARGVAEAREFCRRSGRPLVAIASITGTQDDPQDYAASVGRLEAEGITVMPDNRRAAELAAAVLRRVG